jgi:hypothetical protein
MEPCRGNRAFDLWIVFRQWVVNLVCVCVCVCVGCVRPYSSLSLFNFDRDPPYTLQELGGESVVDGDPSDEVFDPEEDLDTEGGYTPWQFVRVSDEKVNHEVCFIAGLYRLLN